MKSVKFDNHFSKICSFIGLIYINMNTQPWEIFFNCRKPAKNLK